MISTSKSKQAMPLPFDPKTDSQLETLAHTKLAQLEDLPAPAGLVSRVLLEIEAQAALPWWRRSWSYWPRGVQAACLPLLFGCVVVVIHLLCQTWQYSALSGLALRLAEITDPILSTGLALLALLESALVLGRVLTGQPVFWAGLTIILMIYLACISCGALWFRLVLSRRSNL
jgi:hypothetical protein